MKLVQIFDPKRGYWAGKLEGDSIYPIYYEEKRLRTVLDLVEYATALDMDLAEVVDELVSAQPFPHSLREVYVAPDKAKSHLAIPIHPPEVWACGVTYKKSAEFRDEETTGSSTKGIGSPARRSLPSSPREWTRWS